MTEQEVQAMIIQPGHKNFDIKITAPNIESPKPKVYCKGCRWVDKYPTSRDIRNCFHNDNRWCKDTMTFYEGKEEYGFCNVHNRNNDCQHRQQKKWWQIWRG